MTAQATASLLKRMESDEFTHQLAKRLDIQDADTKNVNQFFQSVLTPERHRLKGRPAPVLESMRTTSHPAICSMQTLVKEARMFGGPNVRPLAVIGFLTSVKAAADKALVDEGLALEILPFFDDKRVRGILRQASSMTGKRVAATPIDYRGILKELLMSNLSEDKCKDHYQALRTAPAQSWEDEEMFGRRIQELDYELRKLLGEGELRTVLFAGVPNDVQISARGAKTAQTNFSQLMHFCKSLCDAYRVLHPEPALAPKPEGKKTEPNLIVVPRPEKVERKAAPVLVAIQNLPVDEKEPLGEQQGHLSPPGTPVIGKRGTLDYTAPAGTQFRLSEGAGRRVSYVRTTAYSPDTSYPNQPSPTWTVRTEAPPQIAGRASRLGESTFRLAPGPKAYQETGTRAREEGNRTYGAAPTQTSETGGTSGCLLCVDPQHWVSSCPLILKDSRQAAAQRKASFWEILARAPAPRRQQAPGGVLGVEEALPLGYYRGEYPVKCGERLRGRVILGRQDNPSKSPRTAAGKDSRRARLSRRRINPRVHLPAPTTRRHGNDDQPPINGGKDGKPRHVELDKGPVQDARTTLDSGVGHGLFTLTNFKVSATLGLDPQSTRSYYPVPDTGAGPKLIRKDTLPDKWLLRVRMTRGPTINYANGRLIRTTAAMSLRVTIGEHTTDVDFLVCKTIGALHTGVHLHQRSRGCKTAGPEDRYATSGRWDEERIDSYRQGPDATREPR